MKPMPTLSIRTTLLIIIGVLNILIAGLAGNGIYKSWLNYNNAQALQQGSAIVNALYDANQNLSLARAAALALLYAAPDTAAQLQSDLIKDRANADTALQRALNKIVSDDPAIVALKARVGEKFATLQKERAALNREYTKPLGQRDLSVPAHVFVANTELIAEIQNLILTYVRSYQGVDAAINRQLLFKDFVWELSEFAGQEYAQIGQLIAEDRRPSREQLEQLTRLRMRVQYGWDILHKFSLNDDVAGKLLPYVEEAQTHYFMTFDQIKDLFYENTTADAGKAGYPIGIEMWLGMASQAVDSLLALQSQVMMETQSHVDAMEHVMRQRIFVRAVAFLSALVLSLYCWWIIVFRVARPVNSMIDALFRASQEGTYEMPKIAQHRDEIGKLVRVLEAFQENANKIKRSNEELERFAYIAAHDLKSPLRAVDNLAQWLEEDLDKLLSDDNRKHMNELRRRIGLMDRLLDDTLEYARIDSSLDAKSSEIINAKALIDEISALLAIPESFTIQTSERLSRIHLPKMPIQQVLYNLINNAIKHHDKDQGTITIDAMEMDGKFVFSVRDDGPGIAPQYHQKIFEMFQTLKPKTKGMGRGMGLAMVRKIVTSNGGNITVHSDAGRGAEFRFTWPIVT